MEYRTLGKTGIKTSILGFGAMRLPKITKSSDTIDHNRSIKIIRQGIDGGINFVDTAYIYTGSEEVVGKALQDGYRRKVTLMTKIPTFSLDTTEDFDKIFAEQLQRLKVDYVDILLFHSLSQKNYEEKVIKLKAFEKALQKKNEGKIRFIGFSSHDSPNNVKMLIDTGLFEVVLLQYNFFDRSYEEAINYAAQKGLGVCVMGPLMGGRLAGTPVKELQQFLPKNKKNFAEIAFRFVWSNPNVSIALSGMGSEKMVAENLLSANSKLKSLSKNQEKTLQLIATKYKELSSNTCTQCGYCLPCPNEVMIPAVFEALIDYQVFGQKENAIISYNNIGKPFWPPGKKADGCTECGECLLKCPQKIPIINQLKKAHEILSN